MATVGGRQRVNLDNSRTSVILLSEDWQQECQQSSIHKRIARRRAQSNLKSVCCSSAKKRPTGASST